MGHYETAIVQRLSVPTCHLEIELTQTKITVRPVTRRVTIIGATLPERFVNTVKDIAGRGEDHKDGPEKDRSVAENVTEYTGRVYEQAKESFSKGTDTTKESTAEDKGDAAQGWARGKEEGHKNVESKS